MKKSFALSVPPEFTGINITGQFSITVHYFKSEPLKQYTIEIMPEVAKYIFWCDKFDQHIKAAIMNNSHNGDTN